MNIRFLGAMAAGLLMWPCGAGIAQSPSEQTIDSAGTTQAAAEKATAADTSKTEIAPPTSQPGAPIEPVYADWESGPGHECLVTNIFYDTDVREVLQALSAQCYVNVIADETVSGIITVELENVTLEEAMRRVLSPFGLTFRWMGGYYLVGSPRPDNPSYPLLTETRLYRPNYIKAPDIPRLMSTYYEPFLRVNKETNTVALTGSPEMIIQMLDDLSRIDRPPRQVMIEALVTETSMDINRELGLSWSLEGTKKDESRNARLDAYPPAGGADSTFGAFFQRVGIHHKGWIYEYQARLSALVEEGKAHVRANPRVATLEGHQARIFVGREEYFTILTGSVSFAYAQLEVIKTGISLTITPYVAADGFITLEVQPEVSDVIGSGSTGLPVTNKRSVTTKVRVADGETVVIGGLIVKNRVEVVRKIPLLGSIPILGYLFRHTHTKIQESEITILITPYLWEAPPVSGE